ncbi:MAG: APC family permease [Gammaproteobacteria bacterium]|nr:MAG: APC family permease [Gammaproteobacteria bacterium]
MIGVAALFSTSSAINATLFGSARLSMVMAREKALPRVFGFHRRDRPIPVYALLGITAVTVLFVNTSDLTIISSFASATFLLIFTLINLSALRLWRRIGIQPLLPFVGVVLGLASWLVLMGWLWKQDPASLWRILIGYAVVAVAEFIFSARGLMRR